MPDNVEATVPVPDEQPLDSGQDCQSPDDPVAQMNGYLTVVVCIDGHSRKVWQEIRSGSVLGYVDRYRRPVLLDGVFEAKVVDGLILNNPGSKGEEA